MCGDVKDTTPLSSPRVMLRNALNKVRAQSGSTVTSPAPTESTSSEPVSPATSMRTALVDRKDDAAAALPRAAAAAAAASSSSSTASQHFLLLDTENGARVVAECGCE
jgi:hypothetical protein